MERESSLIRWDPPGPLPSGPAGLLGVVGGRHPPGLPNLTPLDPPVPGKNYLRTPQGVHAHLRQGPKWVMNDSPVPLRQKSSAAVSEGHLHIQDLPKSAEPTDGCGIGVGPSFPHVAGHSFHCGPGPGLLGLRAGRHSRQFGRYHKSGNARPGQEGASSSYQGSTSPSNPSSLRTSREAPRPSDAHPAAFQKGLGSQEGKNTGCQPPHSPPTLFFVTKISGACYNTLSLPFRSPPARPLGSSLPTAFSALPWLCHHLSSIHSLECVLGCSCTSRRYETEATQRLSPRVTHSAWGLGTG